MLLTAHDVLLLRAMLMLSGIRNKPLLGTCFDMTETMLMTMMFMFYTVRVHSLQLQLL